MDRRTLPAFAIGALGVTAIIVGIATGAIWLMLAGAVGVGVGAVAIGSMTRSSRHRVVTQEMEVEVARATAESDAMAARAARFEAEALTARKNLAEATASMATAGPNMHLEGMTDSLTDLFNETFFLVTLDKRVAAARRGLRPLAAILLEVVEDAGSETPKPIDPVVVADALLLTLRDADTACRLDDGRFAMILEDTPENGAVWTVERVRRRLSEHGNGSTLWAGVSCYPAHAFDSEHIMTQAEAALLGAREWRQDRIEVAPPPVE
jgi:GGDEF domain-containing protein